MALCLIVIAVLLEAVRFIGWLHDGDDVDRMRNFGLIFGPIVTLIWTILGFYLSNAVNN